MIKNQQEQKDEWWWERTRVQHVLDYHNKKHKTYVTITGRATDVYPQLKGQGDWDWVCRDTETSEEIAVEVKQLTDEKLEERRDIIRKILKELGGDLVNRLPGTFVLVVSIFSRSYRPLNKHQNKQKFKDVLYEAIFQTAQTLKVTEDSDLTSQISEKLPFALPTSFFCSLVKISSEGSGISISAPGGSGDYPLKLDEDELKRFEGLVSHANDKQLKKAKVEKNILVIIDEGLRLTHPDTIPDAFKRMSHNSYSHIGHAYCVTGEEVAEIPLPTP